MTHLNMQEKTVVLSGTTRGLGLALAREFVRDGWTVYGCGTKPEAVTAAEQQLGPSASLAVVDVTDTGQVARWAADIGVGVPLVIANAGVIHAPAPAWALAEQDFRRVMDVNVLGVYHMARAFMPRLAAGGTFIGISSGWGREAAAGMAAYCASKFAVEGFLQSLALDSPVTQVYPLDPGDGIDTDMLKTCLPGESQGYPSPEAWAARAYLFLTGELSRFPSGTPVTVPGVA